jgi:hypothetical protein
MARFLSIPQRSLASAVFWAALASAAPVRADDDTSLARAKAVELGHEAAEAYKDGRFSEALQKYEEAYHLVPAPPLALNLSRTELKLGRCAEALEYAVSYGAAFGDSSTASVESPSAWIAAVKAQCPDVTISTDPSGASLSIEGLAPAQPLSTPWTGRLPVGSHAVIARLPGHANQQAVLFVVAGTSARLNLTFEASPPGAVLPPSVAPPRRLVTTESRPGIPSWSPWIPAAVAIASLGVGIAEGVASTRCSGPLPPFGGAAANACQINNALIANISYGVSGAGAVTAGALGLVVGLHTRTSAESRPVRVGVAGNGLTVSARF